MIISIINAFFIILPVVLAGITFIIILKKRWFSILKQPLDFSLSFRQKRIFGANKTWLGVIVMSLGTLFYTIALAAILKNYITIKVPTYIKTVHDLIFALIIGASYSLGELPNSFIKRQLNIREGDVPDKGIKKILCRAADVVDSVIGVSLAVLIIYRISFATFFYMIVLGSSIHIVTDQYMKIKKLKK